MVQDPAAALLQLSTSLGLSTNGAYGLAIPDFPKIVTHVIDVGYYGAPGGTRTRDRLLRSRKKTNEIPYFAAFRGISGNNSTSRRTRDSLGNAARFPGVVAMCSIVPSDREVHFLLTSVVLAPAMSRGWLSF